MTAKRPVPPPGKDITEGYNGPPDRQPAAKPVLTARQRPTSPPPPKKR
jgi:hypothetical protein